MIRDVDDIRRDFPITQECVYLDNASLSPLPRPVLEAAYQVYQERSQYGVPFYYQWLERVKRVKELIAQLINAKAEEIALVQNTSEGINIVANMLDWHPGDNVVINDLEFFPNVYPWLRLRNRGVEVRIVKHRKGHITVEDMATQVNGRTRVIALSHVAWINGLKHDLTEIGNLAHEVGGYLVVDPMQSVGAIGLDVQQGRVDFLACGGHKWLLSPLGTGFFYCRQDLITRFEPVYLGWQSDANPLDYTFREYELAPTAQRFMTGNINMAGVHGLGAALEYLHALGMDALEARNMKLADLLVDGLAKLGVDFLSPLDAKHRSQIVNFVPPDPEAVMAACQEEAVIVSSRGGGIRVSPNFYNTEDEIEKLLGIVSRVLR